ncbi:MAG: peptide ABC transporter substrate-binding protein [Candidatus Limnocylindria bacterium]
MWLKKSFAILVVLGLILAACGGTQGSNSPSANASGSGAASGPQILHVDMGGEPPSLDPTQATDSASITVLRSITATLVYFDKQLNVVPWLAKSWDVAPDGQKITFHLQDNIKYSNGDPIVAGDFVFSWKRLVDPRNAAGYGYIMADVKGGSDLLAADPKKDAAKIDGLLTKFGVSAPDDKTFVVELAKPAAYFVYIASLYGTVPLQKKWVSQKGFTEAKNYVGSGPMKLTQWQHNAKIVIEPNPNWNPAISAAEGGAPKIQQVQYSMITDPAASLAAYEANELDIGAPPSQEVSRIQNDPKLSKQVIQGATLNITYFGFDLKNPTGLFTKSVTARKAFSEAINKKQMMAVAFSGIGVVADSLVPPGMPGHQDTAFIPYDLAKAKTDFEAGLKEAGLTKADLKLQIGYNTGANWENKVAFMAEQWRTAFGVEVKPVGLEWGAYLDRLSKDPFDIFRLGWGADYPHPNNFLTDLISCKSTNNNMGYCNKQVDDLLAQAATKPKLEDQLPLYNQAQEMVMKDAPIIPIRFGQRFALVKPWVQNLVPTSQDSQITGENFFAWVSIAPH